MTTKTITIRITTAQYEALAGAIDRAECEWNEMVSYSPGARGSIRAVNNLWREIQRAFNDPRRKEKPDMVGG